MTLRPAGRRRLRPGEILLYRAHRDVHDQKPPAAFSVTLNLVEASGREPWRDQYRFDPARGRIVAAMNVTAVEGLVALAAHLGGEEGRDMVGHLARRHPVDRIRIGAVRALAGAAVGEAARRAVLEEAAACPYRYVATLAARMLGEAPHVRRSPSASDP